MTTEKTKWTVETTGHALTLMVVKEINMAMTIVIEEEMIPDTAVVIVNVTEKVIHLIVERGADMIQAGAGMIHAAIAGDERVEEGEIDTDHAP
jgi:hypothetical protein